MLVYYGIVLDIYDILVGKWGIVDGVWCLFYDVGRRWLLRVFVDICGNFYLVICWRENGIYFIGLYVCLGKLIYRIRRYIYFRRGVL